MPTPGRPLLHPSADEYRQRVNTALDVAEDHGQTDGAHHKMWVIDQMVRALLDDYYDEWVADYCNGGEYEWDTGIAP